MVRARMVAANGLEFGLLEAGGRHLASGSRIIVVEGAGHFPHLEQPDEVNEHILAWASG